MMKKFARIIELPEVDTQLLIVLDYDDMKELSRLQFRTEYKEMEISISVDGPSETKLRILMEKYSHEQAMILFKKLAAALDAKEVVRDDE
jgi:hypothetical protein